VVDGTVKTAAVVLTNPRRSGTALLFDVRPLEGTVPSSDGATSVVIDDVCLSCW
jgi:hypothetical protein